MAFVSNMTNLHDGRTYVAAYVKVTPTTANAANGCSMVLEVWDSQASKDAGYDSAFTTAHVLPFVADLPNSNAVDYAYKLLETSGLYPAATWNVQ